MINSPLPSIQLSAASRHWSVIVIGAGPAGCIAALELARKGVDVLLVDKARFPRYKVCGCCLSATAIDILEQCGLTSLLAATNAVPLHKLRLFTERATAEFPLPVGFALSRERLDCALVEAATACGASFLPETLAYIGDLGKNCRTVELQSNGQGLRVSAAFVVLADGLNGGALKKLKVLPASIEPRSRIGAGVVIENLAANSIEDGVVNMCVGEGGYLGLVRLEDRRIDVAAAFDSDFVRQQGKIGAAACHLIANTSLGQVPALTNFDWQQLDWHGTPALTRERRRITERALFIGDAASYAEPFTGEGIGWAMVAGHAIVPFLVSALRTVANDFDYQAWDAYYARIVSKQQRASRIVSRVLRQFKLVEISTIVFNHLPFLAQPIVRYIAKPRTTIS